MEKKYYKMDLHIHTPASKCYLENKNDEQYFEILKSAIKEKVDIIAITDHNTISGYKRLVSIKNEMIIEREILSKFLNTSDAITKRIEDINYYLSLYNKLLILPGVEITLNPGIHMIVISAPEAVEELNLLLDEVGYIDGFRGSDSDVMPQMDVLNFLECKNLQNKLIIAPHVDSTSGIYNNLEGRYRAAIFKSSIIKGITCNSVKTLSKIKSLVMEQSDYKRTDPLAYINASDAHNAESIGKKVSYACIDSRDYWGLYKAFENPTQYISDVENPILSEIIDNMIKSEKTILIDDLEDGDALIIARAISACHNSDYSNVIFGVDSGFNIKGIAIEKDKMINMIKEALGNIETGNFHYNISHSIEPLGNGRTVYILYNREKEKHIWFIKSHDEAYIYDTKLRKATLPEVINLVEKRLLSDLTIYDSNNSKIIDNTVNALSNLKQPIEKYSILREIEKKSINIPVIVKVKEVELSNNKEFWCSNIFELGSADGKVNYATNVKARLDDAILRYSCPKLNDTLMDNLKDLFVYNNKGIIITEQGATYISDGESFFIESVDKSIFLQIDETAPELFSIYTLMAWLKSSTFIWYCKKTFDEDNIFKPRVFNRSVIPCLNCLKPGSEIESIVIDILKKEKQFLDRMNNSYGTIIYSNIEDHNLASEIDIIIDAHNELIAEMARNIDMAIFAELGYNEKQIDIIGNDLVSMGIFNII